MMRRDTQFGITLIEVLIAISLVSLLSVAMLYAMRVGLTAMDASSRRMTANRRAVGAERVLEQQVAGFLPVVAKCGAAAGPGQPVAFFQGKPSVMKFVTTYSLQGGTRGMPVIVELFVIPGEEGRGLRLVVNEFPYNGPVGAGYYCMPPVPDPVAGIAMTRFPEPQPGPGSFVLADKLASVRFLYLESFEPMPERWLPLWTRMDAWPSAVRIEMTPLEADPNRVPVMPFTGRIRPNRQPMEPYEY